MHGEDDDHARHRNTLNQPSRSNQVQRKQPIRASALTGDITPSMVMLNMSAICVVITMVITAADSKTEPACLKASVANLQVWAYAKTERRDTFV